MEFKIPQELYENFLRLKEASLDADIHASKVGTQQRNSAIKERLNAPLGSPQTVNTDLGELALDPSATHNVVFSRLHDARGKVLDALNRDASAEYLRAAKKLIKCWERLAVVNGAARHYNAATTVSSLTLQSLFLPGGSGVLADHSQRTGIHNTLISSAHALRQLDGEINALVAKLENDSL